MNLNYRLMSEAQVRVKMHEPEPEGEAEPITLDCACGYYELCWGEWKPYLKASGWVLAWYYSLNCPDHGWSSKLVTVKGRPVFRYVPPPEPSGDILGEELA